MRENMTQKYLFEEMEIKALMMMTAVKSMLIMMENSNGKYKDQFEARKDLESWVDEMVKERLSIKFMDGEII
jgi:hypothetical protein